jgi:hypothetical protein
VLGNGCLEYCETFSIETQIGVTPTHASSQPVRPWGSSFHPLTQQSRKENNVVLKVTTQLCPLQGEGQWGIFVLLEEALSFTVITVLISLNTGMLLICLLKLF